MPRLDLTITGQHPEAPRPAPDLTPSVRDIRVNENPPADNAENEDE